MIGYITRCRCRLRFRYRYALATRISFAAALITYCARIRLGAYYSLASPVKRISFFQWGEACVGLSRGSAFLLSVMFLLHGVWYPSWSGLWGKLSTVDRLLGLMNTKAYTNSNADLDAVLLYQTRRTQLNNCFNHTAVCFYCSAIRLAWWWRWITNVWLLTFP